VPCRIIVFSERKGDKAPRENPPNGDYFVFSHGDLSPRHTTLFMRRLFASCLSYYCLAGREVATRKPAKITMCLVFAWRPFAPPGKDTTNRGENAKGCHAITPQMMTFSCFRMATLRPATRKYATFYALRFRLLFVVSLPGDLSRSRPENTFIRHSTNQPP